MISLFSKFLVSLCVFLFLFCRFVSPCGIFSAESLHAWFFHGYQALSQGMASDFRFTNIFRLITRQTDRSSFKWVVLKKEGLDLTVSSLLWPQVKSMANPFAYEEYRKDKIRQKIEESRTQRVQVKVSGPDMVFPLSNHNQKVQSLPLIICLYFCLCFFH